MLGLMLWTACEGLILPVYPANDAAITIDLDGTMMDAHSADADSGVGDQGRNGQAPTLAILTPVENALVGIGDIVITATATDDEGIERVEFYAGTQLFGADYDAPYSAIWSSRTFSDGIHQLRALAVDTDHLTATATRNVELDATLPTVLLRSPAQDLVLSTTSTTIEAQGSDERGVQLLRILVEDQVVEESNGETITTMYDFGASGRYEVSALVRDQAGNESHTLPIEVIVDQAPNALILQPAANAVVGGLVNLRADISDDFAVHRVSWFAGTRLLYETTTMPYDFDWDSCSETDGAVSLRLVVEDSRGQISEHLVGLTVESVGIAPVLIGRANARSNQLQFNDCGNLNLEYRVFFDNSPGVANTNTSISGLAGTLYTHENLLPDTDYYYRVARYQGGQAVGPLSNELPLRTLKEYSILVQDAQSLSFFVVSQSSAVETWRESIAGSQGRPAWSPGGDLIAYSTSSTVVAQPVLTHVIGATSPASRLHSIAGSLADWAPSNETIVAHDSFASCFRRYEISSMMDSCAAETLSVAALSHEPQNNGQRFLFRSGDLTMPGELWLKDFVSIRSLVGTSVRSFAWARHGAGVIMIVDQPSSQCDLAYIPILGQGAGTGHYVVTGVDCLSQVAWSETEQRAFFWSNSGNVTDVYAVEVLSVASQTLGQLSPRLSITGVLESIDLSYDDALLGVSARAQPNTWKLYLAPTDGSTVAAVYEASQTFDFAFRPIENTTP
jgi:hypothetical protein